MLRQRKQIKEDLLLKEALLLSRYLTESTVEEEIIEQYIKACQQKKITEVTGKEHKLWKMLINNSWLIPYLDSALPFVYKKSIIRKKLLTMLAIIETNTKFAHLFLPQPRSKWYIFYMLLLGCFAVIKTIIGLIIIRVNR